VARNGLDFGRPVTFLVGENGTGKSTIVEAIAEPFKIDVRGGHGGRRYVSAEEVGVLSPLLRLLPPQGALHKTKSFFLRTETAKGVLEFMSDKGIEGYGERKTDEVSHGESFLQVLSGRFTERGLYLLDEPETPFSFRGEPNHLCNPLPVAHRPARAHILELSDGGIVSRNWEELELTANWRRFLDTPDVYLRHLLDHRD
jgi:predicted ATPase